jgi:hypothetical protein
MRRQEKPFDSGRERASIRCGTAPAKKIDRTLAEMQQHVDDLQRAITVLATGGSYSINRSR